MNTSRFTMMAITAILAATPPVFADKSFAENAALKVLVGKIVSVDNRWGDIIVQTEKGQVKITNTGHFISNATPGIEVSFGGSDFSTEIADFEKYSLNNWVVISYKGKEVQTLTRLEKEPQVLVGEMDKLAADAMNPSDIFFSLKEYPGISFHISLSFAAKWGLSDQRPGESTFQLVKPEGKVKIIVHKRQSGYNVIAIEKNTTTSTDNPPRQEVAVSVSLELESLKEPQLLDQTIRDILGFAGLKVAGVKKEVAQGTFLEINGNGKIRGKNYKAFRGLDGRMYESAQSIATTLDLKIRLVLDPSRPVERTLHLYKEEPGYRIVPHYAYWNLLDKDLPAALLDALRETEGLRPAIAALADKFYQPAAEALLLKERASSVGPLQDSFVHGNYDLREGVVQVLGNLGDASVVDTLISGFGQLEDMPTDAIAGALDKLDPQWRLRPQTVRIVENLLKGMKSDDLRDAQLTIRRLVIIRTSRVIPRLTDLLRSNDVNLRCAAVEALGTFGKAGISGLAIGFRDKAAIVRKYTVEALGKVADDAVVPYLISALKDSSRDVRFAATLPFLERKKPDKAVVQALICSLKDDDGDVRHAAAEALGFAGDPDAVGPLIDALAAEKIPGLKKSLQDSLEKLTGQHFGEDIEKWRAWFATIQKDSCIRKSGWSFFTTSTGLVFP